MISNYMLFTIAVPPYIDGSVSTVANPRVIVNETLVLNCVAYGTPQPEITWLKGG